MMLALHGGARVSMSALRRPAHSALAYSLTRSVMYTTHSPSRVQQGKDRGPPLSTNKRNLNLSTQMFYDTSVEKYAAQPVRKLRIRQMVEFAGKNKDLSPEQLIASANYVHSELPVRLARRLVDLRTLPWIMVSNPHLAQVYELYQEAFDRVRRFPAIKTLEDDIKFTELLRGLVGETVSVVELLEIGTLEAAAKVPHRELELNDFLNQFLAGRIGRRVLAEQHIAFHEGSQEGFAGVIATQCSVKNVLRKATSMASQICERTYSCYPEVVLEGNQEVKIPFIPYHLEYILVELLKNAMRATVDEQHRRGGDPNELPPIRVLFADGVDVVTLRLSDQGGGIPHTHMNNIFNYGFTTAGQAVDNVPTGMNMLSQDVGSAERLMAGHGFGLPLSRLYAEYFGGNLHVHSMEGFGTDVYLRLDKTGDSLERVEI